MDWIAESKRLFDDDDWQWKNALAFGLHQQDPRLVAQWAILCAERLLAIRFPTRLPTLQNDLQNAKARLQSFPDSEAPEQLEYEIWYRPDRDAAQTAISKLFTAIRELHQRQICILAASAVIDNLTVDHWGEFPSRCTSLELYDVVVRSYLDIIEGVDATTT